MRLLRDVGRYRSAHHGFRLRRGLCLWDCWTERLWVRVQWAMYNIIFFYKTLKKDLQGIHPLPKVLCIKGVVFFTFWYGRVCGWSRVLFYLTAIGGSTGNGRGCAWWLWVCPRCGRWGGVGKA